eukprot:704974-Rhodomonas_salina.4
MCNYHHAECKTPAIFLLSSSQLAPSDVLCVPRLHVDHGVAGDPPDSKCGVDSTEPSHNSPRPPSCRSERISTCRAGQT